MVRMRYTYGEEHQTIAVEDNVCDSIGSETQASHGDAELQYSQAEHGLWQSQDVISGSNHDDDCEFAISKFLGKWSTLARRVWDKKKRRRTSEG